MDSSTINGMVNGVRATRQLRSRVGSTGSGTNSPRSLDTPRWSGISSPLRHSRQATMSPGEDLSEDSGIWLNRETYKDIIQDVFDLKAELLRLQVILKDEEKRNPFNNRLRNGVPYTESSASLTTTNVLKLMPENDQHSDCKRQVVFLQHQLQEKEKTIKMLQAQLSKHEQNDTSVTHDTCNATTQTDKIRPLSTGPCVLAGDLPTSNAGGSPSQQYE